MAIARAVYRYRKKNVMNRSLELEECKRKATIDPLNVFASVHFCYFIIMNCSGMLLRTTYFFSFLLCLARTVYGAAAIHIHPDTHRLTSDYGLNELKIAFGSRLACFYGIFDTNFNR